MEGWAKKRANEQQQNLQSMGGIWTIKSGLRRAGHIACMEENHFCKTLVGKTEETTRKM
jgi:hypothetical protein